MSADPWHVDRLDLAGYLDRLGVAVREPSRAALDGLHEAHVRTFTFDDIDVLLQQHPGVDLDAVRSTSLYQNHRSPDDRCALAAASFSRPPGLGMQPRPGPDAHFATASTFRGVL
jgi:hypothetical protein